MTEEQIVVAQDAKQKKIIKYLFDIEEDRLQYADHPQALGQMQMARQSYEYAISIFYPETYHAYCNANGKSEELEIVNKLLQS